MESGRGTRSWTKSVVLLVAMTILAIMPMIGPKGVKADSGPVASSASVQEQQTSLQLPSGSQLTYLGMGQVEAGHQVFLAMANMPQ